MTTAAALSADELARQTGVTVRTIRYYQAERLLPPPRRVGRDARYGAEHVERLELIGRLHARGLRLSAIAELIRTGSLHQTWSDDRPVLMTADELTTRVGDLEDALVAARLIERRDDTRPVTYLVPSPGLLDIALEALALGLDVATGGRLLDLVRGQLATLADALMTQFADSLTADDDALGRVVAGLPPLARRAVDLVFAHEMERAQRAVLATAVLTGNPKESA